MCLKNRLSVPLSKMASRSLRSTARSVGIITGIKVLALLTACAGDNKDYSGVELDSAAQSKVKDFVEYSRPDTYGTFVQADVLVPVRDGYQLTCDIYRPASQDGSAAPGKYPSLLINFQAYGRKSYETGNDLRDFSKKGYAVIWCNTRGAQGMLKRSPSRPESVAPVNPFAPQEGEDNYDAIEWIAAQPWSTGNVGQIGTSYGGITALRVAGLAPPHLKAIIPITTTHDLYRFFFTEGGIRLPVTGDARGAWVPGCAIRTGEDTCASRLSAEWNSHPTLDEFWKAREANLDAINVPTLFVSGALDIWTRAQDARWDVMGQRDNVATVFGPWPHIIVETANPEMKNMYLAWFDRWVAGDAKAPLPPKALAQGIQAADTANWEGFAAWPPKGSEVQAFYLASTGLQKQVVDTGSLQFLTGPDGASPGLTLRTEPFSTATTLAGPVEVKLPLRFTAPDANIIVNIKSQGADGSLVDLGYAAYKKASHLESDVSPMPRVAGKTYEFNMRVPSKYWTFKAGDRMVLTITSADKIAASDAPAGTVTVLLGADAVIRAPILLR